jgi:hypothetical protein
MTHLKTDSLLPFIKQARAELKEADPVVLAAQSGAKYKRLDEARGELRLTLWSQGYLVTYPDFIAYEEESGEISSLWRQALFLHYLRTADGQPLADRWVSLREIEGGEFYHRASQGYSGDRLAKHFGNDVEAFRRAAERAGGERRDLGDAAYSFLALPRLPLAIIYWKGDEEFLPTAQVVFDASAGHYLPVDLLSALGSELCDRIIRQDPRAVSKGRQEV